MSSFKISPNRRPCATGWIVSGFSMAFMSTSSSISPIRRFVFRPATATASRNSSAVGFSSNCSTSRFVRKQASGVFSSCAAAAEKFFCCVKACSRRSHIWLYKLARSAISLLAPSTSTLETGCCRQSPPSRPQASSTLSCTNQRGRRLRIRASSLSKWNGLTR